jgi:hypothetical protein
MLLVFSTNSVEHLNSERELLQLPSTITASEPLSPSFAKVPGISAGIKT